MIDRREGASSLPVSGRIINSNSVVNKEWINMTEAGDRKVIQEELAAVRDTSGVDTSELVAIAGEMLSEAAEHRELWTMFTCREVEALANVLRRFGRFDSAEEIVEAHAHGDEEDDLHFASTE